MTATELGLSDLALMLGSSGFAGREVCMTAIRDLQRLRAERSDLIAALDRVTRQPHDPHHPSKNPPADCRCRWCFARDLLARLSHSTPTPT